MADFLLPSTPIFGHVRPMLAIGSGLRRRGHTVTVLTGRKYEAAVRAPVCAFSRCPPRPTTTTRTSSGWLPDRHRYRGVAAGRHDVIGLFIRPLPAQQDALTAALRGSTYDAVICETGFLGALPALYTVPAARRLPMIGISTTPLSLMSADCAPFGSGLPPGRTGWSRRRNRRINTILHHGPLRPIQQALDDAVGPLGVPPGIADYFDQVGMFDRHLPPGRPGDRVSAQRHAPLDPPGRSAAGGAADGPAPRLVGGPARPEPVVHVTQGTIDNVDLGKLLAAHHPRPGR